MNLKNCLNCEKEIPKKKNKSWAEYNKRKFCSMKCSTSSQDNKIVVNCINCEKELKRSPSHIRGNVYCSRECRTDFNTTTFNCLTCSKEIRRANSMTLVYNKNFCSMKCQGIEKRKERYNEQGRRSPQDLEWKKQVHIRDGWKCLLCGSNKKLEAHHIKSFSDFPELRYDIDNGETYCHHCHYYIIHKGMPNFKHGRYSKQLPQNPL